VAPSPNDPGACAPSHANLHQEPSDVKDASGNVLLTFAGCTIRVSCRILSLFHHKSGGVLKQGNVMPRSRDYQRAEFRRQLDQIVRSGDQALNGTPFTMIAHSVRQLVPGEHADPEAELRPHPSEEYMEHLKLSNVEDLNANIKSPTDPSPPDGFDAHEACQLLAWTLFLMERIAEEELYWRLLQWMGTSAVRHDCRKPLHTDVTKYTENGLTREIRMMLQALSFIRLSCIEGKLRWDTSGYVYFGLPGELNITGDIGTRARRATARRVYSQREYAVRILVPERTDTTRTDTTSTTGGQLFSAREVIACKCLGMQKQVNLEHATSLTLCDKMLQLAKYNAYFSDPSPWRHCTEKGNDFLQTRFDKALEEMRRGRITDSTLKSVSTWKGLRGQVVDTAFFVILENHVRSMSTGKEREDFVQGNLPKIFASRFDEDHLCTSSKKRFLDWRTRTGKKASLRATKMEEHAISVTAFFSLEFSFCLSLNDDISRYFDKWHSDEAIARGDEAFAGLPGLLSFTLMLCLQFYAPARAIIDLVEEKVETTRVGRCQWRRQNREAAFYAELAHLHMGNYVILDSNDNKVEVRKFVLLLAGAVARGEVLVVDPLSPLLNSLVSNCKDLGTRYYPGSYLWDFGLRYKLKLQQDANEGIRLRDVVSRITAGDHTWRSAFPFFGIAAADTATIVETTAAAGATINQSGLITNPQNTSATLRQSTTGAPPSLVSTGNANGGAAMKDTETGVAFPSQKQKDNEKRVRRCLVIDSLSGEAEALTKATTVAGSGSKEEANKPSSISAVDAETSAKATTVAGSSSTEPTQPSSAVGVMPGIGQKTPTEATVEEGNKPSSTSVEEANKPSRTSAVDAETSKMTATVAGSASTAAAQRSNITIVLPGVGN